MTDEQKKISKDVLAKEKELNSLRDQNESRYTEKNLEIDEQAGLTMSSSDSALQALHNQLEILQKKKLEQDMQEKNKFVPLGIEMREKGGQQKQEDHIL